MKLDTALLDALVEALLRELPDAEAQDRGGAELEAASKVLRESPGLAHQPERLEKLFAKKFQTPVWGTLRYLAHRQALPDAKRLSDRFRRRQEMSGKTKHVSVRSAEPLKADELEEVRKRLTNKFGLPVALTEEHDPAIVGGFLLRSGDWEYDATVQGRIKRLKLKLTNT